MEKDLEKLISLLIKADEEEKDFIKKAYEFARVKHEGQRRLSGEPYFNHLFETAKNIAELGMDTTTIVAGFLHDILEDTETPPEMIEKEFGKEVSFFFNDTATTEIYTLSLHDALPILY